MQKRYFMEMSVQLDETDDDVIDNIRPLKDNSSELRSALCEILGITEKDLHPAKPVFRDPAHGEQGHRLGSDAVYTLFVDAEKVVEVAMGCDCGGKPRRRNVTFEVVRLDEDNLHGYAPPAPRKPKGPGF